MNTLEERFRQAAEDAHTIGTRPETAVLLRSYALYKQATAGDIHGARPRDPVGAAKYDAWEQVVGMSRREAMEHYVALVEAQKG
ncbi:MAG: acyl-CoA-binding protein [Rhodocyclaceae bacterium]|nr:acyl-CoA-binding protein [Rhodocyclaceae bacterium]